MDSTVTFLGSLTPWDEGPGQAAAAGARASGMAVLWSASQRCSCEQLPCFVLPEAQERQFLRGHFPPLRTSDLDLLAEEETAEVSVR